MTTAKTARKPKSFAPLPPATLIRMPRGQRRLQARLLARQVKEPLSKVWTQVFRLPLAGPFPHVPFTQAARPLVSPAIPMPSLGAKAVWHPTKGFRNKAAVLPC